MKTGRCPILFCGLLLLAFHAAGAEENPSLRALDFDEGKPIPTRHALRHENLSPGLEIKNVPAAAKSLALICDDPDAPAGIWTHWLVWNIPPGTARIAEGAIPPGALCGKNDFGNVRYDGPAPPSGTHRYYFRLLVLDALLELKSGATRGELESAAKGHILATAETFGTYKTGL